MTEGDKIATIFEEMATTVRHVGLDKLRLAIQKARLEGDITSREIDCMGIVCDEFGITPEQMLTSRDKSGARTWATAVYVWVMIRMYQQPMKNVMSILNKSRQQVHRYLMQVEGLKPRHKSTAWVVAKKVRIEQLLKNMNYGTV